MSSNLQTSVALGISTMSVARIPQILDLANSLERKLVPCFVGDTGIGKTPIVQAWAKKRGMACRVLNFGHMQPQDVSMALFDAEGTSHDYVPAKMLLNLNEDAHNIEKYPGGAVLFVDELNRAPVELLNAMFTLADERRIHEFHLDDRVLVVGAMNPTSDNHKVNGFESDPAMRKRMAFIHVTEDLPMWLKFAEESGYPDLVIEYLRTQGMDAFYNRKQRAAGKVFATPSAWDKAARIIQADSAARGGADGVSDAAATLLAGILGHELTVMLLKFDAHRAFSPRSVFEAASPAAFDRAIDLYAQAPNDSRLIALRVSTAGWLVDECMREDNAIPATHSIAVRDRFRAYLSAMPAELLQTFLADVGVAVRRLSVDKQSAAWDRVGAFYEASGCNNILRRQTQYVSGAV